VSADSSPRFSPLLRWIGITLVVLTLLQMLAVLSVWQWQEESFRQLVVERLTNQTPMALVGLLLMYLSARVEGVGETRPPILWTVCILSGLLAVLLTASLPIAFGGDRMLSEQAEEQLAEKRTQLEAARQQSQDPAVLERLIRQGEAVGQIPAGVSDEQKQQAARALVDRQLEMIETQVRQAEQTTRVALNQRRYVSSGGAVVLIVAFTLLCLGSVL
jgi:hypothetical protein